MKAYRKDLLENTFLVEEAKSLRNGKFIDPAQFLTIKTKFEQLKTQPNFLVRGGFFLLGILLYSSIAGALALFMMPVLDSGNVDFTFIIYLYAAIGLAGAEFLARNHYYGFGLDDVFVLGFQMLFFTAIGISTESKIIISMAMAVTGAFSCLRYVNTLSALISIVGISSAVTILIIDYQILPTLFLPLMMLLLAGLFYWIFIILSQHSEAYFYQYPLRLLQVTALILGYASVNYLVVRELSAELMGVVVLPDEDIPFAFVFYLLTFAIPIGFILAALKMKSRVFLIVGILTLAFSIFTIRYYYSLMPMEVALILGGIVIFAVAYFGMVKLKNKESGLTFKPDRNTDKNSLLYAQAIIINSQMHTHAVPSKDPMTFGGGGFSGGGAGETY